MASEPIRELFPPSPFCRNSEEISKDDFIFEEDPPPITLEVSNPAKLLFLLEYLKDNNTCLMELKINKYLKHVTGSSYVFLINLLTASEEGVIQVVNDNILEKSIRTPLSEETIKRFAKYENNVLPCDIAELDANLAQTLNRIVENNEGIVLLPVLGIARQSQHLSSSYLPVLLVCFAETEKDTTFLIKLVDETFRYCLTVLLNTFEAEEQARQKLQCQSLLSVARKFFSHLDDLNDLLKEIMSEARRLTNAERCSLFLLDPNHIHLVAKVFDGVASCETKNQVRIAKDQGIAGHVAQTGKILNIKNAYSHPLFYKGVDEATGFKTRNILCFPIRDEKNIIGVAQLCNKREGNFNYFDEEIANAFSIYCGLSIVHSLVYKQIQNAQARNKMSNELMMYHMKVSDADISKVLKCPRVHFHPDMGKFRFSPRVILKEESVCFVLQMFDELGFISKFEIDKEVLTRFLLYIQKGYRDTPYHNWSHAFCVTHFAYLCLKHFRLVEDKFMSPLEALAFFISCLCHDLDHRGTTNSFLEGSNSALANLYSSQGSVMERHHLSQTICTLNTDGCNFIESLNRDDYALCLDLIKDMILATDLATHFTMYERQLEMAQEGFKCDNSEHRYALMCLLMTAADLSDQTKNWSISKKVAQKIYEEFFNQGDLEKEMGKKPSHMMDREKASIPDLQIEFLTNVVLPVFRLLALLFPKSKQLIKAVKTNILYWEASRAIFEKYAMEGRTSLEILTCSDLEEDVQAIIDSLNKK